MPVHSVVITNSTGVVLFTKYYDSEVLSTLDGRSYFERYLFRHTRGYWCRAATKQAVSFLNVHVLLQAYGDLIIFLTGTDDVDELILSDVMELIHQILTDSSVDVRAAEAGLLIPDNYGKLSISLDEMMPDGIIETFDHETIKKMTKLKHFS
mmetsp:Transcript_3728/g.5777  ORF Transcript_3728/g.5777 Transcript_3728/m.5777 type:complete len:152 (+) Transcript_3728:37-492(+)